MKIKVMIAEDELLAREELIYMLEKEQDVTLCPSAETGDELLELYFEHKPDVLFLDIEMPGLTGVEVAIEIMKSTNIAPLFVFTTAYDNYAIDAFEIEAIDYLLKPFDQARLHQALERIRKRLAGDQEHTTQDKQATSNKLLIDDGEKMMVLSPDSIYYAVPS